MTISYSNFFSPTVLDAVAAPLFTVPTTPTATLLRGGRIRLTNTTGAAVSASLYSVPPGESALAGNAFANDKSVPANDSIEVDIPIMPAGASLQAKAGAVSSITAHMISGSYFS